MAEKQQSSPITEAYYIKLQEAHTKISVLPLMNS